MAAHYLYPLTITHDRYNGVYSGGKFIAWRLDADAIPEAQAGGDTECMVFWEDNTIIVGKGNCPLEAMVNLELQIEKKESS